MVGGAITDPTSTSEPDVQISPIRLLIIRTVVIRTTTMKTKVDGTKDKQTCAQRLGIVEPVFANICVHKHMNRFTLRSKSKVDVQWTRTRFAMAHNIGKICAFGRFNSPRLSRPHLVPQTGWVIGCLVNCPKTIGFFDSLVGRF